MRSAALSARELQVLALAAHGRTVPATARELELSPDTVKTHRRVVLAKLAARNTADAVRIAHERGILGQVDADTQPLTDGQRRAFHKKAADVDQLRELPARTTKHQILAQASIDFDRDIVSANDLSRREASIVLDALEQILDGAALPIGQGLPHVLEAAGA